MQEISPYYRIKCLFGGEAGVGKSSIVHLTLHDTYEDSSPTIGMAFTINKTKLEEYPLSNPSQLPRFYYEMKNEINPDKDHCQLLKAHIWDCAGSQRYRSILPSYLRDIDITFLVFDVSNRDTWDKLLNWKSDIDKHAKKDYQPLFVLVGSKSDLKPFAVSEKEIEERAKLWNAEIYIVSCVQSNSSSMIKRMMYNSFLKFHEKILKMQYEYKEIPEHLTIKQYRKENPYLNLEKDDEDNKQCCIIN